MGGTEGVIAVYSQVQGLDRDANLKSTSVHRRSNREGSISPSGNLSGQRDRGVTGDCYAFFVSKEGPALGAAILAGVGAGLYPSVQDACHAMIRTNPAQQPDPEASARYEPFYQLYRSLYPALRESFHTLAAL